MRIEFLKTWSVTPYYEFDGVREQIQCVDLKFCWSFDGLIYETSASNHPKIWEDGKVIASCSKKSGSKKLPSEWSIVDVDDQPRRIIETYRNRGKFIDWKSDDGKRIMTYCRTGCWKATAVIRSDWADEVGILIGLVIGISIPPILRD